MSKFEVLLPVLGALLSGFFALTIVPAAEGSEPPVKAELHSDVLDFTNETIDDLSLHFTLTNNGTVPFSPKLSDSQLIIDGKALPQSGLILGNGPRDASFESLPPGQKLQFVYGLGHYFRTPGKHQVYWEGKGFKSAPISINVRMENSTWKTIAEGKWAKVSTERKLYRRAEKADNEHFFVHIKIENTSGKSIGFDHPKRANVFYPNQWAESTIPRRMAISEMRAIQDQISDSERKKLLANEKLEKIAAGKTFDYFITFNAGTYKKIEELKCPYMILVMDGHVALTDGKDVEVVCRPMQDSSKAEVPLATPVKIEVLAKDARVLFDD